MITLVHDPIFLRHETGSHPECPDRIRGLPEHLTREDGPLEIRVTPPTAATPEQLSTVHEMEYIEYVEAFTRAGGGHLDADTFACAESYEAAVRAAGAVITGVDLALDEDATVFCAVRPPGHHALAARAMGFCLFNSVAVGARHATGARGLDRVAILDFDVHHGNGTEAMFESAPDVLFVSSHQWPFYPGTGAATDRGKGDGKGTVVNLPLPSGTTGDELLAALRESAVPAIADFKPDLLLVSAGFDVYEGDPLAQFRVAEEDFVRIGALMAEIARDHTNRRPVTTLEGGYAVDALPRLVEAYLTGLDSA